MSSLKKFCSELGWPRLLRWKEAIARVQSLEATALVEVSLEETRIEWPTQWTDRGRVRRFDNLRNYPAAGPGIVYDRQICELLGHHSPERVRKYDLIPGPDGTTLPRGWLQPDRYYSYYCTEAHAQQIVERIRFHEQR